MSSPENKNGKVASLVAFAFIGPRPDGNVVRHLDGNKDNNRADNLAYGTHQDNADDDRRLGVRRGYRIEQAVEQRRAS